MGMITNSDAREYRMNCLVSGGLPFSVQFVSSFSHN